MRTIGAKELRLHLDEIFERVVNGEDIIVNYRFKGTVRLSALRSPHSTDPKVLAGLEAFDNARKRKSPFSTDKSIKELYDGSISKKYNR